MTDRDYTHYTSSDFLEDDFFIHWVIRPDRKANAFWQTFLRQHPEKETVVREAAAIIRVYRSQQTFTNEAHREDIWKRIDATIHRETITKTRTFHIPVYMRVAAAVALVAVSAFILFTVIGHGKHTVRTAFGEVKAITLPDQSIVMLNGNSELVYKGNWNGESQREVWIKGEAYFDVNHINKDTANILPGHRFIVHSPGIDIQVLGTSFNVKSRRNKTNIALISGKIEVNYIDPSSVASGGIVLRPGDYVEYAGSKLLTRKKLVRPHKIATWTVREITFMDPSLNDIAETLQDNYGYAINVEDQELMNLKIEGEISVTSVQELLALVSSTLGIRMEEAGNEIIITKR
ncbi:MAG TPA: FecR domain-containing protein [Ohtaekwangia sp.]|uniref:FecR family protein n=1 Tax=Ohtaekwangia sp. TaxID=2066019 RepID=UPI002F92C84C